MLGITGVNSFQEGHKHITYSPQKITKKAARETVLGGI
jgi:hypothetical protein